MSDLHLLRPAWLLALPVGWWLIWTWLGAGRGARGGWSRVVDDALKPFVLAVPEAMRSRRLPLIAALAAWTLAVTGLAGPSFERVEVPAFRSDDALVVALDLSRSMNAADIDPDRLARAKLKVLSLLERRQTGQTALVVFSGHAFTVTPLTSDTRTISSLVSSLSTDIMPSRGSRIEAGLERARVLLEQAGVREGEVLLVTDSGVSPASLEIARGLGADGFPVHVLAVGTEQGAPIADAEGGFVVDASGDVVVPGVDLDGLGRLARAGGGRFAGLAADDTDLDRLFPQASTPLASGSGSIGDDEALGADVWRDEGIWFALLALPLLALSFRRGWVAVLALAFVLPVPRAHAFEWADLWKRPDQRGLEAFEADAPEEAAALFEHPEWRGVAEYRAGDYAASAASLAGVDSPDGHYNRGNALAHAGQIQAAIEAYDAALELDPEHEDARHNRALLEELLEEQQEQQANQPQQGPSDEQQGGEDARDGAEQQAQQGGESGAQGDERSADGDDSQQAGGSSDERSGEQQAQRDSGPEEEEAGGEPQQAEAEAEPGEDEGEGEQLAAAPQDLEQWTSEQAAEQWLRRVPQDPGGLLRRKFLYQYQRLGVDQEGNYVRPEDESEPW